MYKDAVTIVKTCGGIKDDLSIIIGLHQKSVLSLFLFALVIDQLTRNSQDDIPYCILFMDDIILINEKSKRINTKLESQRHALDL